MDIRIIKNNVTYCTICDDVKAERDKWDEEQEELVETGIQEETKQFPGVPGYTVKDADTYKYLSNDICEKCMHTIMKGVNLIIDNNLTGISLNNDK